MQNSVHQNAAPQETARVRLMFGCLIGVILAFTVMPSPPPAGQGPEGELGVFAGQVLFDGDVPTLDYAATLAGFKGQNLAVCGLDHIPNERLIIDPQTKGIRNVFVYLKKPPTGMPASLLKSSAPTVKFDQSGCRFVPHAMLLRTDQTAYISSSDPVGHHAHYYPIRNRDFGGAIRADPHAIETRTFRRPERVPLQVKCDIHPWMNAWWLVLDHPYAAITDAEGKFCVPNLPPGDHEFVVWHESAGFLDPQLVIKIDANTNRETPVIKVAINRFKL